MVELMAEQKYEEYVLREFKLTNTKVLFLNITYLYFIVDITSVVLLVCYSF